MLGLAHRVIFLWHKELRSRQGPKPVSTNAVRQAHVHDGIVNCAKCGAPKVTAVADEHGSLIHFCPQCVSPWRVKTHLAIWGSRKPFPEGVSVFLTYSRVEGGSEADYA